MSVKEGRRLLLRAAATARRAGWPALALAAAPHAAYLLGSLALAAFVLPENPPEPDNLVWAGGIVLFTLGYLAAVVLVVGVTVRTADALLKDEELVPEDAFQQVVARFPRLAGASLLYVVAVALGLALLVVPGILLAARLSLFPHGILYEYREAYESVRASPATLGEARRRAAFAFAPVVLATLFLGCLGFLAASWNPIAGAIVLAAAGTVGTFGFAFLSSTLARERFEEEARAAKAPPKPPAPEGVQYACPRCERVYLLPARPPKGTLCPSCRQASGKG